MNKLFVKTGMLFAAGVLMVAGAGTGTYSVSLPCGDTRCVGLLMNDRGEITGNNQSGIFVASAGSGLVQIAPAGVGYGINNAGVVVGAISPAENVPQNAFAYLPDSSTLLMLNGVFGWTSGTAVAINDLDQIIGQRRHSRVFRTGCGRECYPVVEHQ